MMRVKLILTLTCIVVSLLNFTACTTSNDSIIPVDDIVELKSGHFSSYPEEGVVQKIISTSEEYSADWERVFDGMEPIPDRPSVNFSDREIVLLLLETKPHGGYSIMDVELLENPDSRVINYTEISPGNTCGTIQALTRPFIFISIPKNEKPIKFRRTVEVKDCSS